jgi:hypothetical protein
VANFIVVALIVTVAVIGWNLFMRIVMHDDEKNSSPICAKCGHWFCHGVRRIWKKDAPNEKEHLYCSCPVCGYHWKESCCDSKNN